MDKKPLLDSDIDPKRIHKVADGLRRQGEFESARMLDGYAYLLEALEKAVPVAYAEFADNGCVRVWSRGYEERLPGTRMTPLYTHPSPSDAERLAEQRDDAFQQAVQEARRVWMDEFPCEAGHDHVTPFDQFLYGNRPCMESQPPAASVTDAIVRRMVAEYDAVLCGDPTATRTDGMRAALEAALAAQENPNA